MQYNLPSPKYLNSTFTELLLSAHFISEIPFYFHIQKYSNSSRIFTNTGSKQNYLFTNKRVPTAVFTYFVLFIVSKLIMRYNLQLKKYLKRIQMNFNCSRSLYE